MVEEGRKCHGKGMRKWFEEMVVWKNYTYRFVCVNVKHK